MLFRSLFLLFLLLTSNSSSAHALSLTDIFPPVNIKPSPKKEAPKTAPAREVKSDDTYSNGLNNNQECVWNINLNRTFDPQAVSSGTTNPDGSQRTGNREYEARDIVKDIDLNQPMSNDYFRNVHYFAARGELECDIHIADKPFKNYLPEGKNASIRSTPSNILKYEKGILIEEAILSLDPKNDTLGSDEQLFWACDLQCVKLSAIKSGCRPVTVADIGYYFYQKGKSPVYELLPYGQIKNVPYSPQAKAILANFRGIFAKRFSMDFYMLRDGTYKIAYAQLDPLPRIPENSKFKLTRFHDIEMKIGDTVNANRTLPNAGPATSEQAGLTWGLYSPQNQKNLNNSDPCGNYTVVNQPATDKPSPLGVIKAFVLGLFGHVKDNPLSVSTYNIASYKIEKTSVDNTEKFEKFAAGLIPQSGQNQNNYKNEPSASKYSAETPIDVGYRANKLLTGGRNSLSSFLQPASWKGNEPNNPSPNNPSPNDPPTRPQDPIPSTPPSTIGTSVTDFCFLISTYAGFSNLEPNLVAAIITIESGGNPNAISHQGAVGLMQVMPRDGKAAEFMCTNGPCFANRPTIQQLLNPEYNISYGTGLLSSLVRHWGNLRDGLKHYGPSGYGYRYADMVLNLASQNPDTCK